MFSIDAGKLIGAILRNVPGTFVRDYRERGGWLNIARGAVTIWDRDKDTEKLSANLPAETLCSLPAGQVQASTLLRGVALVRPGWRMEMRRCRARISDSQARAIERDLGMRVFT